MHLGICQNKTVNSFVGRLQGVRTLKISEAMTFRPSRSGLLLHEAPSASFMIVRTRSGCALHFVFVYGVRMASNHT
jgi:hypothetical protein